MYYTDYIIIHEKKLIIEYFSGKINLNTILELKHKESRDTNYNRNYNIIDDSRNAEFLLNTSDITNYINHIRNNELINGKRNAAYLTKTPNQVVIAALFDVLKKELPINVGIVSTLDAALYKVGLFEYDKKMVEYNLEKLRIQSNILQ